MHPIITKGGNVVNTIPSEVCLETYVRARTSEAIQDASSKVDRALRGAALALGCQVKIETVPGYLPLRNDQSLATLFRENASRIFGPNEYRDYPHGGGSTDTGDLSQIMPVLHPMMTGVKGAFHSPDWHISDPDAGYLAPAKTLAMMVVDLLWGKAERARKILSENKPALSKETYLHQQTTLFQTEVYNGALPHLESECSMP